MDNKNDSTDGKKLSDLVAGDKVYCDLSIYTIKRVTPTGRIVTTFKNLAGDVHERVWKPDGDLYGGDVWNSSSSIKPLTTKDRERIMAKRKRHNMLNRLDKEEWAALTNSQLEQVYELIESFEEGKS